jgi:hypothetical protein
MMSHMFPHMNQVQFPANPHSSVKITIPLSTMAVPSQCMQHIILSFTIVSYCIKLVTREQKGSKNSPKIYLAERLSNLFLPKYYFHCYYCEYMVQTTPVEIPLTTVFQNYSCVINDF